MQSTFSKQHTLAPSPIPNLKESCKKLLEWTKPLLSSEEYARSEKVISRFVAIGGDGEKLQAALLEWSSNAELSNWTASLWLEHYLTARAPLVINSNVFYFLKSRVDRAIASQSQIAAGLVRAVVQFKSLIEKGELTIETQKGKTLCMDQYKSLFSTTRIPHRKRDMLVTASDQKHIIVLSKGRIYTLEIVNELGIRPACEIESALTQILSTTEAGQNIGILTTMHRDGWATSRSALLDQGNSTQLKLIEDAVFALCLDENSPEGITESSQLLLHGTGQNRFFDKSLQFIVFKNAKMGINFEHSGIDGSAMVRLIGYLYDNLETSSKKRAKPKPISLKPLNFTLDNSLTATLHKAQQEFSQAIHNTQTRVLNFPLFGKERIKTFNISPDAFVQIALLLAEYKLLGKCHSGYEAIMTRTFIKGRIDVLYTLTEEAMEFFTSFNDRNCPKQKQRDLLRLAGLKHIQRAKECRDGYGIHMHFCGLLYCFHRRGKERGISTLPDIFTDLAYQRLIHTVVCTSTTPEYGLELAGYGPVVEDGYGIRYFTRANQLCFNLTSRTTMKDTLDLLLDSIELTLIEMADLMASE